MEKPSSKISRNVKLFLLSNSCYYGGFDIINAFLSILITTRISHGNIEIVGFVVAYGMLLRGLSEIGLSKFLSKYSWEQKRNIVTFVYILYSMAILLTGFSTQIWQVVVLQTGIAVFDAIGYPLKWSIFSSIMDKKNMEVEWGLEDILSTLTGAVFSAVGGVLSQRYGVEVIFVTFGFFYFISAVSFHFIHFPKLRRHLLVTE